MVRRRFQQQPVGGIPRLEVGRFHIGPPPKDPKDVLKPV
jgi:hypothetical protein